MVTKRLPLRRTSNRFVSFFLIFYYLIERLLEYFKPEWWCYEELSGSTVLITGGGSGIGQLMALNFLKLDCTVIIWDVNAAGMKKTISLAKGKGLDAGKLICYQIDLQDRQAIYKVAKKVQEIGAVDILINNAGVITGKLFLDQPDELIERTFAVNVLAHFWTIKAFLPGMINRKRGHIVSIASVAGNIPFCAGSDYIASKFANVGLDSALKIELKQANLEDVIHTTIVKPGLINTGMFAGSSTGFVPAMEPQYVADCIVSGIRARKTDIYLPGYLKYIILLLNSLPLKSFLAIFDFLGGFDGMSQFTGRKETAAEKEDYNSIDEKEDTE